MVQYTKAQHAVNWTFIVGLMAVPWILAFATARPESAQVSALWGVSFLLSIGLSQDWYRWGYTNTFLGCLKVSLAGVAIAALLVPLLAGAVGASIEDVLRFRADYPRPVARYLFLPYIFAVLTAVTGLGALPRLAILSLLGMKPPKPSHSFTLSGIVDGLDESRPVFHGRRGHATATRSPAEDQAWLIAQLRLPIQFEGEISEGDTLLADELAARKTRSRPFRILQRVALALVVVLALWLAGTVVGVFGGERKIALLLLASLLVIGWRAGVVANPFAQPFRISWVGGRRLQATFSHDGMIRTSDAGTPTIPWSQFLGWRRDADLILLYETDVYTDVLPKRHLSTEDSAALETLLERKLGRAA